MKIVSLFYHAFQLLYYYIPVAIYYLIKVLFISTEHSLKKIRDSEKRGEDKSDHDQRILNDELKNKEYGVLKKEYAKLDIALKKIFFWSENAGVRKTQDPAEREAKNEVYRRSDPLKTKGDKYEIFIGKQFEKNGDLVIYNGLIKGFEDRGIDLIVISSKSKTVNLVQCKNWENLSLTVDTIESIYSNLENYNFGHFVGMECDDINFYLNSPKDHKTILTLLHDSKNYLPRKTLYLSSDKVVDLAVGQHLTMIKPNIFKYKDMKMVVKKSTFVM
jgi:hypothetical protein